MQLIKVSIIAMCLLTTCSFGYGAIGFDSAASQGIPDTTSPVTWTHTVSADLNRVLFVGIDVSIPFGGTLDGVTYNGVSMVLISSITSNNGVAMTSFINGIFRLTNPSAGANTVSATFTGASASSVGGSISLTGVDQISPVEASSCTAATSGTPSVTLTSVADGAWALDHVASYSGIYTGVGASQTIRWNQALTSGSSIGPISPPGSINFTWSGLAVGWADCAASFKPFQMGAGMHLSRTKLVADKTKFHIEYSVASAVGGGTSGQCMGLLCGLTYP